VRLSPRIRKARTAAHLTQSELARRVGVSRAAVANWEHGDRGQPATERLLRIALATDVAYEWLATGRGRMHSATEPEPVLALDVELVEDPLEMRLLRAFRAMPQRECMRIVEYVESKALPQ
jgi:transcriptional regulator with XRE-family HTH domain